MFFYIVDTYSIPFVCILDFTCRWNQVEIVVSIILARLKPGAKLGLGFFALVGSGRIHRLYSPFLLSHEQFGRLDSTVVRS